ncbi:hypothetical protein [Streptomyces sp. NPDC053069]|uniref:hypothetical protein n=1 Tax=Streptomyces sp. NPDC053069 TaxID=3365695 RepID=UPI0037D8E57C
MAATNLFRTLGGSVGVAVLGSLFTRAVPATASTAQKNQPVTRLATESPADR